MRNQTKQIMYAEAGGIALLLVCLTAVRPVMAQSQTPAKKRLSGVSAHGIANIVLTKEKSISLTAL